MTFFIDIIKFFSVKKGLTDGEKEREETERDLYHYSHQISLENCKNT